MKTKTRTDQHHKNEVDKTTAFSLLANQVVDNIRELLKKNPQGLIYEIEKPYYKYVQGSFGAIIDPIMTKFQNGWYVDAKISSHKINYKVNTRIMVISFRLKEEMTEKGIEMILREDKDEIFVSGFVEE